VIQVIESVGEGAATAGSL